MKILFYLSGIRIPYLLDFDLSKYISLLLSHLVAGKLFCCTQPLYEQLINLSSFFILYENNLRKTCLNSFYSFYIELVPFLNDKFRAVELLLLLCRGTIVKKGKNGSVIHLMIYHMIHKLCIIMYCTSCNAYPKQMPAPQSKIYVGMSYKSFINAFSSTKLP